MKLPHNTQQHRPIQIKKFITKTLPRLVSASASVDKWADAFVGEKVGYVESADCRYR